MRILFTSHFFHAASGIHQPGRPETSPHASVLRFAAQKGDAFEKKVDRAAPAGHSRRKLGLAAQIRALDKKIAQQLDQCDFKGAQDSMLALLALEQKHLGPEHPETAITLETLGNASMELKEDSKALEYYAAALTVCRKNPDPETNSLTIVIMEGLAAIYTGKGERASAEAMLTGALQLALDNSVEKAQEPPISDIALCLGEVLMLDELNPRTEEVALLKANPQAWLKSKKATRTLH